MAEIANEDIYAIIKAAVGDDKRKFDVLKNKTFSISEDVVGFLGVHSRLQIEIAVEEIVKTEHFFVKTVLPESNFNHKYMMDGQVHIKEAYMYEKLLPMLKKVRKEKQHWSPKSYLTRPDLIVLEDLSLNGYKCTDAKKYLDYEHVAQVLKSLSELHAASLIFEEKKRTETGRDWKFTDEHPTAFFESFFRRDPEFLGYRWAQAGVKAYLALLELIAPNICGLEEIKKRFSEIADAMYDGARPSPKYRNTICHGDLWANNILFQYKNDIPINCCLVDYQFVRYTPPALDVLIFLYHTTSSQFRKDYMDELLQFYYRELKFRIAESDLDITVIIPYTEFRESCETFRDLAKCNASLYQQMTHLQGSDVMKGIAHTPDAVNLKRTDMVLKCFAEDPSFKMKISEIISDMLEEVCLKN